MGEKREGRGNYTPVVFGWLWDLWWLPTELPNEIILRMDKGILKFIVSSSLFLINNFKTYEFSWTLQWFVNVRLISTGQVQWHLMDNNPQVEIINLLGTGLSPTQQNTCSLYQDRTSKQKNKWQKKGKPVAYRWTISWHYPY